MAPSGITRWGAMGLVLARVMWLILGFSVVLGYLLTIPGREAVVLFVVALPFTAAGLVGLHAPQRCGYGP
jgi:hypothetical protein